MSSDWMLMGESLAQSDKMLVVGAYRGVAGEQRDIRHGLERGDRLLQPRPGRKSVYAWLQLGKKRAAEFGVLVAEYHLGAAPARLQRRREASRAGADDQHVAMGVAAGIGVGIGSRRRLAEARGAADERLVDLVPERPRPHEGDRKSTRLNSSH